VRAVLQHGIGDVRIAELPDPQPGPGEVLLRTRAVTICASDVHMYEEGNVGGVSWDGPFVPGHEMSAVVEDPNGSELARGAPVVVDPAVPCQECAICREGKSHLCRKLRFMDLPPVQGAMRELVAWPAEQVLPIPESIDLVEAPLFEPLCVAVHAVRLVPPMELSGATVAVVGCGAIGLFTMWLARLRGARRVLATDPIVGRLGVATEMGADRVFEVGAGDVVAEVLGATDGWGADVVFEVAGPPEAVQQALDVVRPGGTVVVIGIPSRDEYVIRPSQVRRNEITLRFSRRQNEDYQEAIALVREGKVELGRLLTHRFPLARVKEAFDLAARKAEGAVRVAVTFE
jgi:L-iditol 2-dehydrogenase